MSDLVIRGARVLTPQGIGPAAIHVKDGRIADVTAFDVIGHAGELVEAGDHLVTPGVVDSHVHINEPGRTEWEGFASATAAAAAGGITTVVDMPLNCIPATTSRAAAEEKLRSLEGQLHVDVAFWGGVVPGNAGDLAGLGDFGVPGAKCFLCPSGVDEFPCVTRADLEIAMPVLRDRGLTLLVHAEVPGPLEAAESALAREKASPRSYATYLRSRPNAAEDEAIAMIIDLAREHRCPAHIVHLASASALPMIEAAKADGVPITVETCLHYLTFCAEEIEDGATHFKCAPPIRDRANREALWRGLESGVIDQVVSDHSPCTPALKKPETGDFLGAWGGIAGLQFGLSVLSTLARDRGHGAAKVLAWNTTAPARLAGLATRKGALAKGFDADIVVWDDKASFTITPADVHHRHKITPYAGRTCSGVVQQTWVRGRLAFRRAAAATGAISASGGVLSPAGTFLAVRR